MRTEEHFGNGSPRSLLLGTLLSGLLFTAFTGSPSRGEPNSTLFRDIAKEAGLNVVVRSGSPRKSQITEMFTGGVCVFDYDGDGYMDIYIVNGLAAGNNPARPHEVGDRLYRNLSGTGFADVSQKAGIGTRTTPGMGCAAADFDNDGAVDLLVTNLGPNRLYRNNGDGTFRETSRSAGVESPGWNSGAAWGDFDSDGWLDLYIARYVRYDFESQRVLSAASGSGEGAECRYFGLSIPCGPRGLEPEADLFFHNNGDGTFSEVSAQRRLQAAPSFGLGVCPADYDNDSDLDIFVANDSQPNFLFQNNGHGYFEEVALLSGVAYNEDAEPQACMGTDFADFDNDGWLDLVVTNFSEDTNTVYRNEGDGFFVDASTQAGQKDSYLYMGWGVAFADLDNDGARDLYVANGHIYPDVDRLNNKVGYNQRDLYYRNRRGGNFDNVAHTLDHAPHVARGLAAGDFNNDGWLDLVISNLDATPNLLLRRPQEPGHWFQLNLIGRESNRNAIGARVTAVTSQGRQIAEVKSGCSYLSSSDPRVHFGLGDSTRIEKLHVRWPSGRHTELLDLAVDQQLTLEEPRTLEHPPVDSPR